METRQHVHCADEFDVRDWGALAEEPCTPQLHASIDQAEAGAYDWMNKIADAVRRSPIGMLEAEVDGRPLRIAPHVIDPSLAYFVFALARRGDTAVGAMYIGLVAQEPNGTWRGLTGYYLPWCSDCHHDEGHTLDLLMEWLPEDGHLRRAETVPAGMRPHAGWFDDRFRRAVLLPNDHAGASDTGWQTLLFAESDTSQLPGVPALVCIGPVTQSLANIVLLDSFRDHVDGLARAVTAWPREQETPLRFTYRLGAPATLRALAGLPARGTQRSIEKGRMPGQLARIQPPISWGAYRVVVNGQAVRSGIARNLRAVARAAKAEGLLSGPSSYLEFTYPQEVTGVTEWTRVRSCKRALASLAQQGQTTPTSSNSEDES